MIHQIIPLDSLRPEEIAYNAQVMYEHGHGVEDCPYPSGSDQAIRWRRAFYRAQIEAEAE